LKDTFLRGKGRKEQGNPGAEGKKKRLSKKEPVEDMTIVFPKEGVSDDEF